MFFCFTIAMHSKIVSIARLVLIEGRNCWHYVWMSLMMVSFTLPVFIGEYDCWLFVWMYLMVVSFILHSKVDVFKLHVFIGGCASVRKTSYLRRRHKSASVVLATLMATVIVVVLSLPKNLQRGFYRYAWFHDNKSTTMGAWCWWWWLWLTLILSTRTAHSSSGTSSPTLTTRPR